MVIDDPLRKALVAHHLRLTPACALTLDRLRGADVRAAERTLAWVESGLRALFALNRAWFVGFKAAGARLPTLPIQPVDTPRRIAAALTRPDSAEDLVAWIDELYGLAAEVADVAASRARFHLPGRAQWTPEAIARVRP